MADELTRQSARDQAGIEVLNDMLEREIGPPPARTRESGCPGSVVGAPAINPEQTGAECRWCGAWITDGTTCPRSVECPTCGARPGGPCRRPSGHNCDIHVGRIDAAAALDV